MFVLYITFLYIVLHVFILLDVFLFAARTCMYRNVTVTFSKSSHFCHNTVFVYAICDYCPHNFCVLSAYSECMVRKDVNVCQVRMLACCHPLRNLHLGVQVQFLLCLTKCDVMEMFPVVN